MQHVLPPLLDEDGRDGAGGSCRGDGSANDLITADYASLIVGEALGPPEPHVDQQESHYQIKPWSAADASGGPRPAPTITGGHLVVEAFSYLKHRPMTFSAMVSKMLMMSMVARGK